LKHWHVIIATSDIRPQQISSNVGTAQSTVLRPGRWNGIDSDLARKVHLCASAIIEAQRMSQREDSRTLLNQLVARASDLLDDIDELLVRLDPHRDSLSFATAARLHRDLEQIQAGITDRWRSRTSTGPGVLQGPDGN